MRFNPVLLVLFLVASVIGIATKLHKSHPVKNSAQAVGTQLGGTVVVQEFHRDSALVFQCGLSNERISRIPDSAAIGVYYPLGYQSGATLPVFFAMHYDAGNGLRAIDAYKAFADSLKFLVAAVDVGDPKLDIEEARYFYLYQTIDYLTKQNIINGKSKLIGGFSGGAKWALQLGAWGGDIFNGILAIGCNEDFASLGYNELLKESAFALPIVMLNGTADDIAGTSDYNYRSMVDNMRRTGFLNVHVIAYDGRHEIPQKETMDAFAWLLSHRLSNGEN